MLCLNVLLYHKWLEGRNVSLDIDDKTGQDQYGRWIAVCYIDGKNFNMQLVDAGHAEIDDFKDNEFDPMSWWTGYYPGNKETKVYHNNGCAWASLIEQGNLGFFASPGQAISEGYHPCGKCDPPITQRQSTGIRSNTVQPAKLSLGFEAKVGDEKLSEENRERERGIQRIPLHQTATLAPLEAIEIKKKRWWQFWR